MSEVMEKSMTRRPEVGLNDECVEIASRAFRQHKIEDPFFVRHWVFVNAVAEAYQLGISREQNRQAKLKPLSPKAVSSFLYQATKKHIQSFTEEDVRKNGINIITPPEIKIDKSIAITDNRKNKKCKYPWKEMSIGDSFFTESNVRMLAYITGRNTNKKYSVRKENNGYRAWRTA
jgi:hypothetical protein